MLNAASKYFDNVNPRPGGSLSSLWKDHLIIPPSPLRLQLFDNQDCETFEET